MKDCCKFLICVVLAFFIGCNEQKKPVSPKVPLPTSGVLTQKDFILDFNSNGIEVYRSKDGRFYNGDFSIVFDSVVYEKITLKDGLLDGEYIMYKEDGSIGEKAHYKNGKKEGVTKKFADGGKLNIEKEYKNNKLLKEVYYTKEGEINFIKEKNRSGSWIMKFFEKGQLSAVEYDKTIDGRKYGITKLLSLQNNDAIVYGLIINADDTYNEKVLYVFDAKYKLIDSVNLSNKTARKRFNSLLSNKKRIRETIK